VRLVEMSYLQSSPVVMDDSALQKLLGPMKKTSYDEGIRKTLESMHAESAAAARCLRRAEVRGFGGMSSFQMSSTQLQRPSAAVLTRSPLPGQRPAPSGR
jgi:hypothetical protein